MLTVDRIRECAREKGIKLSFLCSKIGLSARTYFNDVEKNERAIPPERLQQIAEILDVSVEYLLGKTDKKNNPAAESSKAILSPKQQELWELIHSLPEDLQDKATEMLRLFVESVSKGQ